MFTYECYIIIKSYIFLKNLNITFKGLALATFYYKMRASVIDTIYPRVSLANDLKADSRLLRKYIKRKNKF